MITLALFIETLFDDPMYFGFVFATVVFSITLHELAHGWAALWQGDPTPRLTGHMTPNPIVHMGVFSLVLFVFVGIAFGAMPVDPKRFRSKYGHAMVAAAGPLMNLLLALIGLTVLGVMVRVYGVWGVDDMPQTVANTQQFFWVFGVFNVALLFLNLLPVPPLDGSAILANFVPPYDRLIKSVTNPGAFLIVLIGAFYGLSYLGYGLIETSMKVSGMYLGLILDIGSPASA